MNIPEKYLSIEHKPLSFNIDIVEDPRNIATRKRALAQSSHLSIHQISIKQKILSLAHYYRHFLINHTCALAQIGRERLRAAPLAAAATVRARVQKSRALNFKCPLYPSPRLCVLHCYYPMPDFYAPENGDWLYGGPPALRHRAAPPLRVNCRGEIVRCLSCAGHIARWWSLRSTWDKTMDAVIRELRIHA